MNRNTQIAILVIILSLCCCLVLLVGGLVAWSGWSSQTATPSARVTLTPTPSTSHGQNKESTPPPEATPTPGTTPTPGVTPSPTATPMAADPMSTEQRLLTTELPQRDVRLLAERLKKTGPIPVVVHETPPIYRLGEEAEFWVGNVDSMEQFRITAVLEYITPHLYVWVEKGLYVDKDALARSAENFERSIYPTDRAFFGSEWTPGVDGDPHLHILHSSGEHMGATVAGYYSSSDEYSSLANPYSNEREMFYISLDGATPDTDFYDGVLAHEFQHMIHWANDRNEETWVNEGCSELAAYLNGYDPGGFEWIFMADPDVQLTTWSQLGSAAAHYGNSYLFMAYFLGRFGEDTIKRVIAHPANGTRGFDLILAEQGLTFEEVFADWLVANYVDNTPRADPRYTYPDHVIGPVADDVTHNDYPVQRRSDVSQYAGDYVVLQGDGDLRITFQGENEAKLVPVEAYSGQYAWWSNRGDDSDTTLTRAFDLSGLEQATLRVWMWYDIERDWDYAYVAVSTDEGLTWNLLEGPSTTTSNPNGNSFGPAYTGKSGGWIEEVFDLSAYAGQRVLLRFEYITDDAVNHAGWLIDDLSIPELEYAQDFESGPEEWEFAGFIYSDNRVAQHYLVQLITFGRQTDVIRLPLDASRAGSLELYGLGSEIDSAVLVISAIAPVTTELAAYEYTIEPIE